MAALASGDNCAYLGPAGITALVVLINMNYSCLIMYLSTSLTLYLNSSGITHLLKYLTRTTFHY
jgi:hypothetical protein